MKKYLRLLCSECKRITDKLVDDSHYTPDKCIITFKCEGRLSIVEYRSNGGITSSTKVGITDWRPRGTIELGSDLVGTTFVNTSSGSFSQIILAVQLNRIQLETARTLTLSLSQRADTPKAYRQYVFRIEGAFTSVSGVEAGLEKKTLRYSSTDTIDVFLNGVKLVNGTDSNNFQLYNGSGSNGVPSNTVNFNSQISLPGVTQVDVIVSPAIQISPIELVFNRNINDESRRGKGAWENVDSILRFNGITWVPYYLFYLDLEDGTALKLNSIMTVDSIAKLNGTDNIQSSAIQLLLSHAPYTQIDRYENISIPLDSLNFETEYFKYYLVDGSPVLYATKNSISSVYPPMRVQKFSIENTIKVQVPGVSNQIVVDGNVIVGPDA